MVVNLAGAQTLREQPGARQSLQKETVSGRTDGWANDCSVSIIVKERLFILIGGKKTPPTTVIIVGWIDRCEEQTTRDLGKQFSKSNRRRILTVRSISPFFFFFFISLFYVLFRRRTYPPSLPSDAMAKLAWCAAHGW